jgi:cellulose synthase/poly-beta-1,6-N-acetylglucosamine synthase-like glycosyltransferase
VNTLSVVIPATDGRASLERAVAAVHRAALAPEELIVVDEPAHLIPASARNIGAGRATGDVLVFVDADVEVHDDAFVRIRTAFDENPQLAAVFGAYDDEPVGMSVVSDFRNLLHHHVHRQDAGRATTFWTGLGAVRRDAFLEVGGFDESLSWIEDIEFGMRLSRQGGVILLDPSIQGRHLKRWTLASMVETDLFRRAVPWLRLLLENRSNSTALNLGWRHRVGTGTSVVLVTSLMRRNLRLAAATLAILLVVDRDFYRLLARKGGSRLLAAGVPLHVLHRLTAVAAVPIAVTGHVLAMRERRRGQRD